MARSLSDLFSGGHDDLRRRFREVQPAPEAGPVPRGRYTAVLVHGEWRAARSSGTPAYVLRFEISEGPLQGRCVWMWLGTSEAAMPYSKRDLARFRITEVEQLDRPLARFRCVLDVSLHQNDDGKEFNDVRIAEVLGEDEPPSSPFAPAPLPPAPTASAETTTQPPAGAEHERS